MKDMKYQKHLLFLLSLPVKGMAYPRCLGISVVKLCEVLSHGHGFLTVKILIIIIGKKWHFIHRFSHCHVMVADKKVCSFLLI